MSMLFTLLFTCPAFFSVSMISDFSCTAHDFFPKGLSNHYQSLRPIFSEICTKFNSHSTDPRRNRIRPDMRLQIKGRNKSARPPSCVKFCMLTPNIWYYCHLPLQLLYRWQHQSRKLWMLPRMYSLFLSESVD
jgi:hypothetical protein